MLPNWQLEDPYDIVNEMNFCMTSMDQSQNIARLSDWLLGGTGLGCDRRGTRQTTDIMGCCGEHGTAGSDRAFGHASLCPLAYLRTRQDEAVELISNGPIDSGWHYS